MGEAVQASRQVAELQARTSLQQAAASPASVASFDDLSGFKAAVPTVAAAAATASAVIDEAPGPTPAPSVTVVYSTGWTSACLHYNADGNGWTAAPGARMQEGSGRFPGTKVFTVQVRAGPQGNGRAAWRGLVSCQKRVVAVVAAGSGGLWGAGWCVPSRQRPRPATCRAHARWARWAGRRADPAEALPPRD